MEFSMYSKRDIGVFRTEWFKEKVFIYFYFLRVIATSYLFKLGADDQI